MFFLVFAVAIREVAKALRPASRREQLLTAGPAVIFAAVCVALLMMLTTFSLKAAAEYYTFVADRDLDKKSAIRLYRRAFALDPDYYGARLHSSGRSYAENNFAAAADELRMAIDGGLGVVITYSSLADCETKMGDPSAAEKTFAESLRIFPRSVFVRIRYALFLRNAGRFDEADAQIAFAHAIDAGQAAGWQNLLTVGSVAAFYAAQNDPAVAAPADLVPAAAVLQYLDKEPTGE